MNHKQLVAMIVSKGQEYRTFRRMVGDQETAQRILELTDELNSKE